ncbi:hypothetical protein [Lutimaribacter degradans]|nr:hypothetical protein [Lutimaribacter sp. EGI FJ00013]
MAQFCGGRSIWVYGPGDDSVIAFTRFGIENLQELIEMDREHAR